MAKALACLAFAVGVAIFPAMALADGLKNPFKGSDPAAWTEAVQWVEKLRYMPEIRSAPAMRKFSSLDFTRRLFRDGTSDVCREHAAFDQRVKAYNTDFDKWTAEAKAYEIDRQRYEAARPGTTKETLPAMQAWYSRLQAQLAGLQDRKKRLQLRLGEIGEQGPQIQAEYDSAYSAFIDGLGKFNREADRAVQLFDLDMRITGVEVSINGDRQQLNIYAQRMPNYYRDIEAMAEEAEATRAEQAGEARDKAIGMALDGFIRQSNVREKLTREKLRQVKQLLVSNGVRPADTKMVLTGWVETKDSVKAIRQTKGLFERLDKLHKAGSILGAAERRQYAKAIVAIMELFVEAPLLKLGLGNAEIYSGLLYTGLSYSKARDRVMEMNSTSEKSLEAIAKISDVYKKHIKQLKDLKKQRDAFLARAQ